VLATENELLCKLDCATIRSETLEMVGGRTGNTLQDLNRVSWYTAATAVMEWATETRLILIVRVNVDVLVLLKATEVIVFLAWPNNTLLDLVWREVIAWSWALYSVAATWDLYLLGRNLNLVSNNFLFWLCLHTDCARLFAYVAGGPRFYDNRDTGSFPSRWLASRKFLVNCHDYRCDLQQI